MSASTSRLVAAATLAALLCVPASAAEPFRSAAEIVDALARQDDVSASLTRGADGTTASRGARPVDDAAVDVLRALDRSMEGDTTLVAVAEAAGAMGAVSSRRLNLAINFAPDSAEFDVTAYLQLQALADALRSKEMAGLSFLISGHTDASGTERHNAQLSKKRADAVRRYLTQRSAAAPSRLIAIGLGESMPLDGVDPNSMANRRVEIAAID